MTPAGLLHSEIHGLMPTYGSPWLIAVSRVLHRLSVPRHSPCALCSLTMCFSWFFFEIVDFTKNRNFTKFFFSFYLLLYSVFNVRTQSGSLAAISCGNLARCSSPSILRNLPCYFSAAQNMFLCSRKSFFFLLRLAEFFTSCRFPGRLCVQTSSGGGLKWTRTTDLTLIRRAL